MTKPTLLIMAAGMGSRYGGLKQIDPVGPHDEIVLDYSIHDAANAGFGKVVFVIRKDIEDEFKRAVGSKYEKRIQVEYAFQDISDIPSGFSVPEGRTKPWGTAHAILAARDLIHEPFAALNADDFYGTHAFTVLSQALQVAEDQGRIADYSMVAFTLRNTLSQFGSVSRGICTRDEDMNLTRVVEHTTIEDIEGQVQNTDGGITIPLTGDELVSMNMWGFTPSFFDVATEQFKTFLTEKGHEEKSEFYIPAVVDLLISQQRASCKVIPTESSWFGVTYQDDKPYVREQLKELVSKGAYESPLW